MTLNNSIAWCAVIIGLVLFLVPISPIGYHPVLRTAGIVTMTLGLFVTAALPEYLSALIFFFLCLIFSVAPPDVVFSGFLSGAVWLVLGGLILGIAIEESGLAMRIARNLEKLFGGNYLSIITGTVVMMTLLAFLMPSAVGRVTIMLPVILALADRLGFVKARNGRIGMVLAVGVGTLIPTFSILPSNVPNVVLAGAAEAIHKIQFTYSDWFILHFPVIGLLSMCVLPLMIRCIFPDEISARNSDTEIKTPLTIVEKKLICILIVTLTLWGTDNFHGVSPAWISLGAGIFCALPFTGLLPAAEIIKKINFGPIIFLAGVIGMGSVVTQSGLGEVLANWLIINFDVTPGDNFGNFLSVVGIGFALQLVTTLPGQPAIMTAVAESLSVSTGWPLVTVLMAQVSAWALVIFPYQAPPLVATKAISGLPISAFLRLLIPFVVFGWLVSVPLQFLWWEFLGYFPN